MNQVSFTLTESDALAAARANSRGQLFTVRLFVRLVIFVVLAAIVVGAILLAVGDPWDATVRFVLVGAPVMLATIYGLIGLILVRTIPAQARRNFRRQKALWETVQLVWSPQGLDVTTASAQARRAWSHYLRWRETAEQFLLYQTDQLYIIVPKRAFASAEAMDGFRAALVAGNLPRAGQPG